MPNCVLIVGSRTDPHVRAVWDELKLRGINVFILDRYSSTDTVSIHPALGVRQVEFKTHEGIVCSEQVGNVWWRLKPLKIWSPAITEEEIGSEFATTEWNSILFSLPKYLKHASWVNPLPQDRAPSSKAYQLMIAVELGLAIPDTLISNDPAEVTNFLSRQGRTIYKQISNFMFPPDQFIFTNEIDLSNVTGSEASVQAAPGIYQALVPKLAEWRITVVNEQFFPVKIDSQKAEVTSIDWRRDQLANMYEVADLNNDVKNRILLMQKRLGIIYGAYDFIETMDGRLIFLECNPSGQWLWLEEATGVKISECIADHLSRW